MYIYRKRTVIYNLPPFNEDLLTRESLASYLIRLSNEHHLTVNDMLRNVLEIEFNNSSIVDKKIKLPKYIYENSEAINGFGKYARELVIALNELSSREGLNKLTFLNWKKLIPSRNLLDKKFKYCPDCLKEWNNENKLYYPLIWGLKLVEVCVNHQRKLISYCLNCNEQITFLRGKMVMGKCSKCFNLFFEGNYYQIKEKIDDFQEYVSENLKYLLSLEENHINSYRDNFIANLNWIRTEYFNEELGKMSESLQLPKTTLYEYLTGEQFPSLKRLMHVGYCLDIPTKSLLEKEGKLTKEMVKVREVLYADKKIAKRHSLDEGKIEEKLRIFLNTQVPFSLVDVAGEVGRDRKLLYNHFPILSKKISNNFLEYSKNKTSERRNKIKLEIEKAFQEMVQAGIYPSRRKIEKEVESSIGAKGVLREKELQNYWLQLKRS
ncbi:TniQ family protein [Salimicrobium flavidum]|uniref:TniQ protein n=1 Tax=Salimicrobium flavidum TaxID=570947 RepID=A0A1N7J2B3_9BACI|nr:TniQ family protein [Salimicrobium flavidum]SIS43498.1 TniQ protein [Salimicrobium flavidum]